MAQILPSAKQFCLQCVKWVMIMLSLQNCECRLLKMMYWTKGEKNYSSFLNNIARILSITMAKEYVSQFPLEYDCEKTRKIDKESTGKQIFVHLHRVWAINVLNNFHGSKI